MAIRTKTGYECSYCRKYFTNKFKADDCRDSHDLVYVPLARTDVARLLQFIITKEERILTEPIYLTLQQIVKREKIRLGAVKLPKQVELSQQTPNNEEPEIIP
jgi:hypothetical protein